MDWNVYGLIQKPAYQAILFLLLTPILIFIVQPKTADRAWLISFCAFVVFLAVNAVMLWFDAHPWRYFFYAIGSAVGYIAAIAVIMPALLKILQLKNSEEGAMAFLILIYQPFLLLLIMLVKWMVAK